MKRRALIAALAAAPLLTGGCAAPQSAGLARSLRDAGVGPSTGGVEPSAGGAEPPAGGPDRLPGAFRVDGVPFHAQRDWECGPASLAMAMAHAGVTLPPEALVPEVWVPARQGSLQPEMLAAPRRRGLLSVRLGRALSAPLAAVAGGQPVVVFQNLGLGFSPLWHYAVLIGYDLAGEKVVLHTGVDEASELSIHVFERTWVRAGSWAMTVTRPDRLPQGADEASIVQGMAALERVAPAAARPGWSAILARWPQNRTALLGLGNAAWAAGDRPGARTAWQEAVRRHPDFADAWNNLAHALAESGERAAARDAAQRAVEIGGPRIDDYRRTLEELSR